MKITDIKTIAVRALNHLRREHLPSYVALRRLLGATSDHYLDSWLHNYIVNKPLTQNSQPYYRYQIFKGIESGEKKYRECFAPSPTTSMVEALLLDTFSSFPKLQSNRCVYSYLWPENDRCGHSFKYFLEGYRDRELEISKALSEDDALQAYVTDIRSFYPSIPHEPLVNKLLEAVASEDISPEYKRFITETATMLLSNQTKGIPIGSSLGHCIANLALYELDELLESETSIKYFRYVDDIVIVASKPSIDAAQNIIQKHFERWNLGANEKKTEIVSSFQWISKRKRYRELTDIGFEEWKNSLVIYLAYHPGEFDTIERSFKENSFNLPFGQFKSQTTYSRFKYYLNSIIGKLRFSGENFYKSHYQAIEEGKRIKEIAINNLEEAISAENQCSQIECNWHLQTIRYLSNRLLFLCGKNELTNLLNTTCKVKSIENISDLIRSILSNDVSHLVEYPGYTVNAFCQLHSSIGDNIPCFTINIDKNFVYPYSIHSLMLYGLIDETSIHDLSLSANDMRLSKVCLESHFESKYHDFSYLDEVNTLLLPQVDMHNNDILNSRFSDLEDTVLDSTLLDDSYNY